MRKFRFTSNFVQQETVSFTMRISHQESGTIYELSQHKGNFKLADPSANSFYLFKDSYEAIWCAVELIRNNSFDKLSEEDMMEVAKYSQTALSSIPKSLIAILKREKIDRTYYDQIFLKLLSLYRAGNDVVVISNKTNFIVHYEIAHLLRNYMGTQSLMPTI